MEGDHEFIFGAEGAARTGQTVVTWQRQEFIEHAHDLPLGVVHAHALADRVVLAEQLFGDLAAEHNDLGAIAVICFAPWLAVEEGRVKH